MFGNCYDALGDYEKAIDYHEQSLAIDREIGDRDGEARSLTVLGNCYDGDVPLIVKPDVHLISVDHPSNPTTKLPALSTLVSVNQRT